MSLLSGASHCRHLSPIADAKRGLCGIQERVLDKYTDAKLTPHRLVEEAQPQQATSHRSKKQQAAAAASAARTAADAASRAAADAAAAAAADVIVFSIPSFPEKEISLGQVRHRLVEPLFHRVGESVQEVVARAAGSAALNGVERVAVWDGLGVVGEIARFKCGFIPI